MKCRWGWGEGGVAVNVRRLVGVEIFSAAEENNPDVYQDV